MYQVRNKLNNRQNKNSTKKKQIHFPSSWERVCHGKWEINATKKAFEDKKKQRLRKPKLCNSAAFVAMSFAYKWRLTSAIGPTYGWVRNKNGIVVFMKIIHAIFFVSTRYDSMNFVVVVVRSVNFEFQLNGVWRYLRFARVRPACSQNK